MTGAGRIVLSMLLAGWLADELARPDGDVEAGIEAYEAGDHEEALERFEAAIARHGDRPELSFDRGLALLALEQPDEARRAFERATESSDAEVRASAFYEVGNVAFDAEDYAGAVQAYIECLKARPDHSNAKWNLELAQQKLEEQQEDEEEEDDSGTGGEDSGGGSDDGTGGSDGGTGGEGSGGESSGGTGGDEGGTGGSDGGEDSGGEDSGGSDGGEDSGGEEGDSGGGTGEDEPPSDTDGDDEGTGGETPPPPPVDQMDLQKALDELDEQDHFPLDRPVGGQRPPTKDW